MHPGYTLLAIKQPELGAIPCAARAYRQRSWSGIAGSTSPSPTWGRYRLGAAGRTGFSCGSGHGAENNGSSLASPGITMCGLRSACMPSATTRGRM